MTDTHAPGPSPETSTISPGQPAGATAPPPDPTFAPITPSSVVECLESAKYWISVLPNYANDMQARADRWAITSGSLSAIGGLSVWATLDKSTRVWAEALVAVVSFLSALAALVPRIKNYGEMAGQARQLTSSYGRVEGHLVNAYAWDQQKRNDEVMQKIIEEFDNVKSSKDTNLRDLPPRLSRPKQDNPPVSSLNWPADTYYRSRKQDRDARHRYERVRMPWWPRTMPADAPVVSPQAK